MREGAGAGGPGGNVYDKYGTRNPVARLLMRGFLGAVEELVRSTGARSLYEAGCGEGLLSIHLARSIPGLQVAGSDVSAEVIAQARANAARAGVAARFEVASVYDLRRGAETAADVVICCEVLEHLEEPEEALRTLAALGARHMVLSVPREPLWRVLNLARGAYWGAWGNTPGHRNHWSRDGFVEMVSRTVRPAAVRTPLPWTVVLAAC